MACSSANKFTRTTQPRFVNKQIKHRTDVVGAVSNRAALLRLVGAVLTEQHGEWESGYRRDF
jgi:transposase-like protein